MGLVFVVSLGMRIRLRTGRPTSRVLDNQANETVSRVAKVVDGENVRCSGFLIPSCVSPSGGRSSDVGAKS